VGQPRSPDSLLAHVVDPNLVLSTYEQGRLVLP
jgi:hypothetical protein